MTSRTTTIVPTTSANTTKAPTPIATDVTTSFPSVGSELDSGEVLGVEA